MSRCRCQGCGTFASTYQNKGVCVEEDDLLISVKPPGVELCEGCAAVWSQIQPAQKRKVAIGLEIDVARRCRHRYVALLLHGEYARDADGLYAEDAVVDCEEGANGLDGEGGRCDNCDEVDVAPCRSCGRRGPPWSQCGEPT